MKALLLIFSFIFLFANQKVSILLDWKYQFEFAGYIAAKEKGFYKDAGLDVKLVEYNNNNIIDDVIKGKYDFGIYNNYLVNAKIEGKPIKLISSIFKRSALVLITQPYIKTLKDLEHKKIMLGLSDKATLNFLQENGVNLSTIKFIPTNFQIKPFVDKKIDAMTGFVSNEKYRLDKEHIKFNIINPSDYNFVMYQGELFTNDKFANQNPIIVDKIKNATIKGWQYALKHKEEIINIILKKYNTQHKTKDAYEYEAKEIQKIIEPYIYPIGYINKPLLKSQFEYESKKLHKNINIDDMLDDYIFSFENPLNLDKKYLPIIKLYNCYLHHKTTIYIVLVFLIIILIILYFYRQLKQQKNNIQTLFDKAPIAYVLLDAKERKILDANKHTYDMFGYSKHEEIIGENTKKFYKDEKDYMRLAQETQKYIAKHNSIEGFDTIWKYKRKDGSLFWVNLKAMQYDNSSILWTLTDISKLIETQNKLNKQIQETKKAMKVKEEFLANMSHEIRTPLNAMLGFINILSEKETDKEKIKYLDIIKNSGKSLLTIINDILDFSKIESGKLKIEKIEFNPKEEFKTLISLFETKANEKNINLQINLKSLEFCIISDPIRIKQVIANLLSNAIKFTPNNKNIYCNIRLYTQKEELYVEVIDEGIGISKEHLKTIFNPFAQADTSTTRKYGGTGLGLTISKNLISLLGGELKVESEVNKGTKFYFSIPVKITNAIKEKKSQKTTTSKKFNAKVLIVEDNKANQMFFKVILNSLGIKDITIANDGLEGVQKANNEFDIIFMDENMPNMNGLQAAKKIKENGINVPIIAVTANALSGDKERFLKVMDDYIPKPVEKEILIQILSKYLKDKDD